MNRLFRFGVVGGGGATGRVVVAELWRSCEGAIRIAGRDIAKANALAAGFDQRVSACHLDVFDDDSLSRFCRECSIIVNCGGPVMALQDRVAQAALQGACHYVDLASLTIVKERMEALAEKIEELELSFVTSAGWLPGLSEFIPFYAYATAKGKMDVVDSVTAYFGDSGEWSVAAFQDMAWFLRRSGLRHPGFFHRGERVRTGWFAASPKVDLGGQIGRRQFNLVSMPEIDEVGRRLIDCDFFAYAFLPGFRVAMSAALVSLIPIPNRLATRMLRRAFRRTLLPVGGFVVARVRGSSQGRRCGLDVQVVYDKRRDYWINGTIIATVARLIAEGGVIRTGIHYLADSVDPIKFMAELRKAGIEPVEKFE
jgi:hypothetical protein